MENKTIEYSATIVLPNGDIIVDCEEGESTGGFHWKPQGAINRTFDLSFATPDEAVACLDRPHALEEYKEGLRPIVRRLATTVLANAAAINSDQPTQSDGKTPAN